MAENKTVTMVFPKRLVLTLDDHTHKVFNPGPQEVPEELANHWYLKANGVTRYQVPNVEQSEGGRPVTAEPIEASADPEEEEQTTVVRNRKAKG